MAAVLCKGLGDCIRATCNTVGNVCLLPCKLCECIGVGFEELCSGPFSAFVVVATLSQLPPIVVALMELGGLSGGCQGSLWLLGALLFGIINIAAAFYLAIRAGNTQDESLAHLTTAFQRASYLLCHDPWIAIYILIAIGYFAFLFVGASWTWSGSIDDDESCSDSVSGNVSIAIGCGWFFFLGGSCALAISMCCACCDQRDYSPTSSTTHNGSMPPGSAASAAYQNHADVENPAMSSGKFNKTPQQPYTAPKPAPSATGSTTYGTQQGVPGEPEIPMAYAEAVPDPEPSAPPSSYDTKPSASSSTKTPQQSEQQQGSAYDNMETAAAAAAGGSLGTTMGKNVGKLLFKKDEAKQKDLENKGKQAGEAIGKGLLNAKKFVQSQVEKQKSKKQQQQQDQDGGR